MTTQQLIEALQKFPYDTEVMYFSEFLIVPIESVGYNGEEGCMYRNAEGYLVDAPANILVIS